MHIKLKYGNTNTFFIRGMSGNLLVDTDYAGTLTALLRNIGIDGEIVATTSHSADSISLILDSGECFVGDLEPIEYLAAYEQNDRLKYDWELVMQYAPKKIYYAHANEKIL